MTSLSFSVPNGYSGLFPEHIRALSMLQNNIDNMLPINSKDITKKVWVKNSMIFIDNPFTVKNIPNGSSWRWNQVKSKRTAILHDINADVLFFKIVTRKREKRNLPPCPIPSIKMWVYKITYEFSNIPVHCLWTERGITKNEISTYAYKPVDFPHISKLEFLSEFMDKDVVKEIWPKPTFSIL